MHLQAEEAAKKEDAKAKQQKAGGNATEAKAAPEPAKEQASRPPSPNLFRIPWPRPSSMAALRVLSDVRSTGTEHGNALAVSRGYEGS